MAEEGPFGVTLWSTDVSAMADFLHRVAGAEIEQRHPGFASLRTAEARITIHDDESYRGHPWFQALSREGVARGIGIELRFRVASVAEAFAVALKGGALSIAPPFDYEDTRECQVMGPDGYVLSLWQVWNVSTSS